MKQDIKQDIKQEIPLNIGRRICCIYLLCISICIGLLYILYMMIEE